MAGIICISGNDPSGGSGIAVDIRASSSIGTHCFPVISSIASQTHDGVLNIEPVPPNAILSQIKAALTMGPGAMKIGLLHSHEVVGAVVESLKGMPDIPIVVDPVLSSSSAFSLVKEDLLPAFKGSVIPISTLLTPNIPEAETLTGSKIQDQHDIEEACWKLNIMGADHVLLKGGHLEGEEVIDTLFDGNEFHRYPGKRVPGSFRGTGCSYSTLIACYLSRGLGVKAAIAEARAQLQLAIVQAAERGQSMEGPHILFLGLSKGGGT